MFVCVSVIYVHVNHIYSLLSSIKAASPYLCQLSVLKSVPYNLGLHMFVYNTWNIHTDSNSYEMP